MSEPRITLWIKPNGDPLYVQPLYDLSPDEVRKIFDAWDQVRDNRPIILGEGWEIRVLGDTQ